MGGKHSQRRKGEEAGDPPCYPDDWPVVEHCSLKKWKKRRALLWGFLPTVSYSERRGIRFQPAATGGRHLIATVMSPEVLATRWGLFIDEDGESTESLPPFLQGMMDRKRLLVVEDMLPKMVQTPETLKLSGLMQDSFEEDGQVRALHRVNVIGGRDDFQVLQVVRASGANKIVLIKELEQTYQVLHVFTVETEDDNPYLMEATLSPDFSRLLLQPSWAFGRTYRFEPEKNDVCLYDLTEHGRKVPDPRVIFPFNGESMVVAFDPRYPWTRLVSGCRCRMILNTNDLLQIHDLTGEAERGFITATSAPGPVQTTQNLVFSPDGRFLASLVASVHRKSFFQVIGVLLYDSDQLTVLKEVRCCPAMLAVGPMPYTLFPMFSMNGRYMAVYLVEEGSTTGDWNDDMTAPPYVSTLAVPVDLCLQNLCRLTLRRWLMWSSVEALPLPPRLKNYLLFRPDLGNPWT